MSHGADSLLWSLHRWPGPLCPVCHLEAGDCGLCPQSQMPGQQCWLQLLAAHLPLADCSGFFKVLGGTVRELKGSQCSSPLKLLSSLNIRLHRFNHAWLRRPQSCPRHLQASDPWVTAGGAGTLSGLLLAKGPWQSLLCQPHTSGKSQLGC